jgi:hypothetical protein
MKRIFTLLSFTILSTFIFAQPVVSTWVGTGAPGQISSGTPRLSAGMEMPYGVAMDSRGNIWISEEGGFDIYGFVIKMVQPSGNTAVRAGGVGQDCFKNGGGTASRFSQPRGLAVDASDNIYVADFGNCVIRKITKFVSIGNAQWVSVYAGKWDTNAGCYTTYPGYANGGVTAAMFNGPSDIAIDKTTGAMYVADANNHCIRKILNGQVTTVAGHPDSAGFRDGTTANAKFNYPTGVFVAANGDIYVADRNNQRIRKISGSTVSTVVAQTAGLWTPDDVLQLTNGDLLITDQHRIRLYSGTTLSTFAGSSLISDFGDLDGTGTNARFYNVKCIVADNVTAGAYYVADQSNHKIRRVVSCATSEPVLTVTGGHQKSDSSWSTSTGDTIYLTTKDPYTSYLWSTGETTRSIIKTSSATVYCTVTNSDGCLGKSENHYITISPLQPKITPNGPTTFCPGDSVLLLGDNGYDWYKWTRNGTTFKEGVEAIARSIWVTDKELGDYELILTLGPCTGTSSKLTIATSSSIVPTINILKGSANLCENDTLIVEVAGTYSSYQWKKNGVLTSTTKSLTITTAGDYTASVTQSGGCSGTSEVLQVVIIPAPPVPTFTVTDTLLWSTAADAYQWYFNNQKISGATTRGHAPQQSGMYFVEITGANGCKARSISQNVVLSVLELSEGLRFDIYPNPTSGKLLLSGSFTSAGDFNIRVVNMMGEQIFTTNTYIKPGKFEKQIDLQGNPTGIYLVVISSNGKQGMMKLLLK